MANVRKLRGKIIEAGKNIDDLAPALGMHRSTLYRKLSDGGEAFTVGEANQIMALLNLSPEDAMSIFFAPVVASHATTAIANTRL